MKNIGFATVIAGGIAAAALGFAGPAQALADAPTAVTLTSFSTGIDHQSWIDDMSPSVSVPQVDTGVHQSR